MVIIILSYYLQKQLFIYVEMTAIYQKNAI